jgi:hypothetical protein
MTLPKEKLFQPKYSQKIVDFMVDKIEGGMTLAEVCREYGPPKHDAIPNEKTCYRWKKKYPEFKKALDGAYQTLIFKMMDEMNDLSKEAMRLADELARCTDIGEAKFEAMKLKGQLDAVKTRIKALEFMLTRIAPKMVPELQDTAQGSIAHLPAITIVNYSDAVSTKPRSLIYDQTNK